MLEDAIATSETARAEAPLPARILAFLDEGRAASSREIIDALGVAVSDRFHVAVKRLVEQGRVERLDRGRFRRSLNDSPDDRMPFQDWLASRSPGETFAIRDLSSQVMEPYQIVTQRIETLVRAGEMRRLGRGLYAIGVAPRPIDLTLCSKSDAVRAIMARKAKAWTVRQVQEALDAARVPAVASQVLGNMAKSGGVIRLAKGIYVPGRTRPPLS